MTTPLALPTGTVAGLRTMTAPAAVSRAAHRGRLRPGGSGLAFLASALARSLLTLLARVERRREPWARHHVDEAPAG